MEYNYRVCESSILDEDNEAHTVYGIELYCDGALIASYKDVFFERERAESLTYLCNKLKLSPEHFHDVLEDETEDY